MIRSLLPLLAIACACADYDLAGKANAEPWDTNSVDDVEDTGEADDTGDGPSTPAWYVVRADLQVAGAAASSEGASITLDVVDEDLEHVDCVVPLSTDGIVAGVDVDTVRTTTLWWEVPVASSDTSCATLPETLTLGIGEMHPDVRARLGSVGHDDIAHALYAAYLVLDGAPVAFGYAGTDSDLLGDDEAVSPAPDGLYHVSPLYLVPLPE